MGQGGGWRPKASLTIADVAVRTAAFGSVASAKPRTSASLGVLSGQAGVPPTSRSARPAGLRCFPGAAERRVVWCELRSGLRAQISAPRAMGSEPSSL